MPELIGCKSCGLVHSLEPPRPGMVARCRRCGAKMARHGAGSLHLTAAFSLSALLLYVPANVFPIMRMYLHGATAQNTVWQGCVLLFKDGQFGVAAIVFLASILIPLLKLCGLFYLQAAALLHVTRGKRFRMWIARMIESIGRWAMLDVFVLAILVSLVKLQRLATILPGAGLVAFTGVVVFTLLASASFDPRLIWEPREDEP